MQGAEPRQQVVLLEDIADAAVSDAGESVSPQGRAVPAFEK